MAKDPELDHLLDGIVTTADCMGCRLCCYFHDDDKVDAPLFTEAQRDQVQAAPYGDGVTFSEKNGMWQVDLVDRGDESYVCPLLDQETHACNAREVDCFDCRTWPFYVMRKKNNQTVLTLSPDCPVAAPRINAPEVQQHIAQTVLPYMIARATDNPNMIAEFRPEIIIVAPANLLSGADE